MKRSKKFAVMALACVMLIGATLGKPTIAKADMSTCNWEYVTMGNCNQYGCKKYGPVYKCMNAWHAHYYFSSCGHTSNGL